MVLIRAGRSLKAISNFVDSKVKVPNLPLLVNSVKFSTLHIFVADEKLTEASKGAH